ncbi:MAG: GspE/PulE/PilB domain-containing protein [Planctomycetota bacterium]|jgi:type IV pilus assembly protein PilB
MDMLTQHRPFLIQLLMDRGAIGADRLAEVQAVCTGDPRALEAALVREHLVTEQEIAEAYAQYFRLPVIIDREPLAANHKVAEAIGRTTCRDCRVVPLAADAEMLRVAMASPTDQTVLQHIEEVTGLLVCPVVASVGAIDDALADLFAA